MSGINIYHIAEKLSFSNSLISLKMNYCKLYNINFIKNFNKLESLYLD